MEINHINKTLAEMMGWKFFQLGEQLPDGKYGGGPGWWTGSTFIAETDFTPATNRDHAFMAWDSLNEEEQTQVHFILFSGCGTIAKGMDRALNPETLCRAILGVKCPGWEQRP